MVIVFSICGPSYRYGNCHAMRIIWRWTLYLLPATGFVSGLSDYTDDPGRLQFTCDEDFGH